MIDWVGSRRLINQYPEFTKEIDEVCREYRGPGVYKSTGERVAPLHGLDFNKQGEIFDHGPRHWVKNEEDYEKIWANGKN